MQCIKYNVESAWQNAKVVINSFQTLFFIKLLDLRTILDISFVLYQTYIFVNPSFISIYKGELIWYLQIITISIKTVQVYKIYRI